MLLFGLRPTILLHYINVNMLRMCSFTYHRGNLLTNRNGDRQTFVGIRKHFRDRSRGFAIFEIRGAIQKFVDKFNIFFYLLSDISENLTS